MPSEGASTPSGSRATGTALARLPWTPVQAGFRPSPGSEHGLRPARTRRPFPPDCHPGLVPSMDAPGGARVFSNGLDCAVWCCRLSGLCLRPVWRRGPVWHTRTGSKSGSCALRHPGTSWFSRSRLIDRLSLPVPGPRPHCRRRPASAALRRRSARAPGSSLVSWSSPRRCARCGWPAPRRSASSTSSWPASRPARGRGPRRRARRF